MSGLTKNSEKSILDFLLAFGSSFPEITQYHFFIYKPHLGAAAQIVTGTTKAQNLFAETKWLFEKSVIDKLQDAKSQ